MAVQKRANWDWDDVRVFLALAELGSLSAAARALGVNHTTVARRMARFETALGSALIERAGEGYVLTAAGRAVLDDAQAMETAAAGLRLRAEAGETVAGQVRISTLASFAEHVLAEPMAALAAAHPGLEIELEGEDRNVSLGRGDADVAVRFGRPSGGEALGRRVGDLGYRLYATADYLAAHPPQTWSFIGFTEAVDAVAPGSRRLRELAAGRAFPLRFGGLGAQARAAAAGGGVALLPSYLAEAEPRLARATAAEEPDWSRPIWLLLRADARRIPRVRRVADEVASAIRVRSAALSARGTPR